MKNTIFGKLFRNLDNVIHGKISNSTKARLYTRSINSLTVCIGSTIQQNTCFCLANPLIKIPLLVKTPSIVIFFMV